MQVSQGSCGYVGKNVLHAIVFQVGAKHHVALQGSNGSGKSTLLRTLLGDPEVVRSGEWHIPLRGDIGYLDQHYDGLNPTKNAMEVIGEVAPEWSMAEIREHLSNFLFRKSEEVVVATQHLSGGEKCRLFLARIAARTPKMLILDVPTNNLDLITRAHLIAVVSAYPGAVIVVSHDQHFLEQIQITSWCQVVEGRVYAAL